MDEKLATTSAESPAIDVSPAPVKKVVVVLNESIDVGRLMNACAHLAMGFGASRDSEEKRKLLLLDYQDASGESHPFISGLSVIVLKANSNQLRTLRQKAHEANVTCIDFLSSMTEGSYQNQLERTRCTAPDDLGYFGVLLFGDTDQLRALTRRYSLFRSRIE